MEDDDEDYDYEDDEVMHITPQRFSWVTVVRAGLDFLGHVAEGAACAIKQLEGAVVSHEIHTWEQRAFEDSVRLGLESLPCEDDLGSE